MLRRRPVRRRRLRSRLRCGRRLRWSVVGRLRRRLAVRPVDAADEGVKVGEAVGGDVAAREQLGEPIDRQLQPHVLEARAHRVLVGCAVVILWDRANARLEPRPHLRKRVGRRRGGRGLLGRRGGLLAAVQQVLDAALVRRSADVVRRVLVLVARERRAVRRRHRGGRRVAAGDHRHHGHARLGQPPRCETSLLQRWSLAPRREMHRMIRRLADDRERVVQRCCADRCGARANAWCILRPFHGQQRAHLVHT
mmetsp:Transcript_32222/g.88404  ORF Transcript_32222/g.88404 Transcript_32222/m.88404 type:complete len:252 (-) Transcript_32222:158-913(-)